MKVNLGLASDPTRVSQLCTSDEAALSESTHFPESTRVQLHARSLTSLWAKRAVTRVMLTVAFLSIALLGQLVATSPFSASVYAQQTSDGFYYTVQLGDSWGLLSDLTGVSVAELQRINPSAVRYNQWLRVGEKLFIPGAPPAGAQSQERSHIVKAGESWSIIAAQYDLSSRLLKSVNPNSVRDGDVLYLGEQLTIPSVIQPVEREPAESTASEETAETDSPAAPQTQTSTQIVIEEHQVGGGDSWSIIAAVYGVSISELKAANPGAIRENDVLYFGETLSIPTRVVVVEPAPATPATDSAETPATTADGSAASTDAASPETTATEATATETTTTEATATDTTADETMTVTSTVTTTTAITTTTDSTTGIVAEVAPITDETNGTTASSSPSSSGSSTDASEESASDEATTDEQSDTESSGDVEESESADNVTGDTEGDAAGGDDSESDAETESTESETTDSDTTDSDTTDSDATDSDATDSDTTDSDTTDSDVTTSVVSTELELDESGCPLMFSKYAQMIQITLADPEGDMAAFQDALEGCNVSKLMESGDWTEDGIEDTLIIIQNQESEFKSPEGDILIFNGLAEGGFELAYQARSAGKVDLLSNEDINEDGQSDIAWIDTTCGASTCFSTVNVRSWADNEWQDWTDGTLTMAYPDIVLDDVSDEGQSSEILMSGGIYGSAAAGPQRGRAEVWASVDGAPYSLLETNYDESLCLYFTVIDGNEAFMEATPEGFAQAKELYEQAVNDSTLSECWERENEGDDLRSFSQFRLALVAAYNGEAEAAATQIEQLNADFPDALYTGLGQTWLDAYQESGDVVAACEAGNEFAEENPDSWNMLADFGYFNPSFSASDVCPILDVEVPEAISRASDGEAADEADGDAEEADSEEAADEEADSEEADSEEADSEEADSEEADSDAADGSTVVVGELPTCPEFIDGFVDAAADALTATGGDAAQVEEWMRSCDALTEDRGALINYDMNGDGANDFILFPTIVSDAGYGPDGTEGLVLIYHTPSVDEEGADGPEFELTAGPNVFGKPVPIGIADYNVDGQLDLAFTVEGCSSFCVDEVQILTWNGEVYVVTINPGATIAEGTVSFAPVEADSLGQGQSIVLSGGVSGTPEGGLNVPHDEIWQSIDGKPYERIRWTYDREAQGANCLGLRLIEADVALQSASTIGYDEAIERYTASIDPTLEACSIHGISAAEELILLQGLASFRLIQAHAFNGDLGNANTILDAFSRGQPDGVFTSITTQWLEEFNSTGDAVAACEKVRPIIEENEETWQITDHYGYNHPSLAAQQICFIP